MRWWWWHEWFGVRIRQQFECYFVCISRDNLTWTSVMPDNGQCDYGSVWVTFWWRKFFACCRKLQRHWIKYLYKNFIAPCTYIAQNLTYYSYDSCRNLLITGSTITTIIINLPYRLAVPMCVCATSLDFEQEVVVDVVNLMLEIEFQNSLVDLLISHYTSKNYNLTLT